ncbi:MAG: hypothetical protein PHW02_00030 [bacterium]|nr:hypothetical protein [bacterium]
MRKLIFVFLLVFAGLNIFSNNEIPNDLFFLGLNGKVKEFISIVYANGKQEINQFSHKYFNRDGFMTVEMFYWDLLYVPNCLSPAYRITYYAYISEDNKLYRAYSDDSWSVDDFNKAEKIETYNFDEKGKIIKIDLVNMDKSLMESTQDIYYDEKERIKSINKSELEPRKGSILTTYDYSQSEINPNIYNTTSGEVGIIFDDAKSYYDSEDYIKGLHYNNNEYERYYKKNGLCKLKLLGKGNQETTDSIIVNVDKFKNTISWFEYRNDSLVVCHERIIVYY